MTYTVTVTGYNSDGEGVARLDDGRVVFVRCAARDDVLEIRLIQELSKVARAEIVQIITASPHRIETDCAVFPTCGGCDYRHISYEEELYAKMQCVNDALSRIGGLKVSPGGQGGPQVQGSVCVQSGSQAQVREILRKGQINGYRNKAILHSDGTSFGFYQSRSHNIVPINNCLLLKDDLNAAIKDLSLPAKKSTREGFSVQTKKSTREVTLRSGRNGINKPIEEEMDGLVFKIEGFFQVNSNAASLLFQKAREYAALSKSETLIDLYCGVGALTLFVGRDAGYALGVEQNADAVEVARENAKRNNFSHIEFLNADAAAFSADLAAELAAGSGAKELDAKWSADSDAKDFVAKWRGGLSEPDCIIVDPPRKGLSSGAINRILKLAPKRLVYISCNPATLARDIKALHGYSLRDICAVDMFPRTANIECCCLLEKQLN